VLAVTINNNGGTNMTTTDSPPAVAGLRQKAPHLHPAWLPAIPELEWFRDLRARHVKLAGEFAAADARLDELVDERDAARSAYRRECRAAIDAGTPVPERPAALGEDAVAASRQVALEQRGDAEDALAELVVDVPAVLRERRAELEPYLSRFGTGLLDALHSGPGGQVAVLRERLKRELSALEDGKPAIEVFQ
jgi:hypothetical protein